MVRVTANLERKKVGMGLSDEKSFWCFIDILIVENTSLSVGKFLPRFTKKILRKLTISLNNLGKKQWQSKCCFSNWNIRNLILQ